MTARVFVDTNVFVYTFEDGEPKKRDRAVQVLGELGPDRVVVSTQLMQELFVTIQRKFRNRVGFEAAFDVVRSLTAAHVVQMNPDMVLDAIEFAEDQQVSFWDAMLVRAAVEGNAGVLLSEDFQHGQRFGELVIENPFLDLV